MCVFVEAAVCCSVHTLNHTCVRIRICVAYSTDSTVSACPFEHENVEDEERSNPFTVGLVLYGHTYLSRFRATVQCMTMCKGTVDGKKVRKRHSCKLSCNSSGEDPPLPLTFNVGKVGRYRTQVHANNINFAKPTDAHARQH